ncbi:uncharacterized protein EI97DRAFT_464142 [Westerdykella ornata]|uniref:Mitochondrial adapter protein MCP1 transmembrane domain-containing protein n=1 Tax=Westerdykella ornata TaxID=318751 RepID=A0A6A6JUQ6_WESOR|nr:uncharacterized protein EI97DRAFT_464142 [Westerdykella ornata]KAF2280117.1 hypothetical protein EI97DRAFT_464142 [Westerdykella ornata]
MGDGLPETPDAGMEVTGLTEVEPSPVEETPIEFKEEYFPFSTVRSASPTTSVLGLGSHGPAYYLTRVQKYSSYAFTVFTAFHITNTSIIPLLTKSVTESNRYLLLTRPYYQSALTEPLLVAIPLVAHITSGLALRFYRRSQSLRRYGAETRRDKKTIPWPPLSGTSALGYLSVVAVGSHMWTTRILPLYMHGDSSLINLSYVSHSFELFPYLAFGGMTALVGIATWHTVWGWAKWLGFLPSQVTVTDSRRHLIKKRRWYMINAASALVAGLWMAEVCQ